MKRLSSLMLRKWKKERWSRRRSEPCGGEEEEEEEGQTDRQMARRKSDPCGRMKDCRRTEEWTRNPWVLQGPGAGGPTDGRGARRRRSEPPTTLHNQLLPVSNRTSKELKGGAGGTSCSQLLQPRTAEVRGRSKATAALEHSKQTHPQHHLSWDGALFPSWWDRNKGWI